MKIIFFFIEKPHDPFLESTSRQIERNYSSRWPTIFHLSKKSVTPYPKNTISIYTSPLIKRDTHKSKDENPSPHLTPFNKTDLHEDPNHHTNRSPKIKHYHLILNPQPDTHKPINPQTHPNLDVTRKKAVTTMNEEKWVL